MFIDTIARVVVVTSVLTLLSRESECSKILMIPADQHSHVNFFAVAAKALQDGGHDVSVLTVNRRQQLLDKLAVKSIYLYQEEATGLDNDAFEELLMKGSDRETIFTTASLSLIEQCEAMLSNDTLMTQLEDYHYDVALVDGLDFARCHYIIPYRLKLPYITLTAQHDPWNSLIPAMPSVEPYLGGFPPEEDPGFFWRFQNLISYIFKWYVLPPATISNALIEKHAPLRPKTSFEALYRGSEMWLVNADTLCLDFPRVHAHHFQFVAGLGLEEAKPLDKELEEFVRGSGKGIIVVSFGSAIKQIPMDMMEKMLHAFAQIEQRVVMRYKGTQPEKIPTNVKLLPWIPQNDLLGHPKARLFVTHGGNNGQLEAVYHGLPMVNMPLFGDQMYNAKRVEINGHGVTVSPRDFTADEFLAAIKETTTNRKYKDSVRRCSERFRSFPRSQDTLTFWVEHVVRFGGAHLKPRQLDMPLWKFFMLDILSVLGILSFVVLGGILWLCCLLGKRFAGKGFGPGKKKQ